MSLQHNIITEAISLLWNTTYQRIGYLRFLWKPRGNMFAMILFYVNPFINKFMYDTYLFLLVPYYLPWEKDVALPLKKKLNSLHPSMLYAKFGSGGEAFLNFVKWLLLSPLGKGCCPSFEQSWIQFTQGNFSKESALSNLHLHLCCYLKEVRIVPLPSYLYNMNLEE